MLCKSDFHWLRLFKMHTLHSIHIALSELDYIVFILQKLCLSMHRWKTKKLNENYL